MIFTIANQNVAIGHNSNTFKSLEFGITGTPWAESTQEASIRMEDLYAIVARIGHTNVALVINRNASVERRRSRKL